MSHARSSSASGWRRERFSLSIIVHVVKGRLGINNPGAVVGSLSFLRIVGQFFIRYTFRSSFHQILEPPSIDQWTTKVFAIDIGGWVFLLENWKIFKRTISIEFSLNFFYYTRFYISFSAFLWISIERRSLEFNWFENLVTDYTTPCWIFMRSE